MIRYLFLVATVSLSAFSLESPTFLNGGDIPRRFGCAGDSVSPELIWSNPPVTSKAFVLIVTDTTIYRVHAQKLNIARDIRRLPEGGFNMAPICPPPGERHSYEFALYALDNSILNASDIEAHLLAVARITGYYQTPAIKTGTTKKVTFLSGT